MVGSPAILSPARKTINHALTSVAKSLPDEKAEALVHPAPAHKHLTSRAGILPLLQHA